MSNNMLITWEHMIKILKEKKEKKVNKSLKTGDFQKSQTNIKQTQTLTWILDNIDWKYKVLFSVQFSERVNDFFSKLFCFKNK